LKLHYSEAWGRCCCSALFYCCAGTSSRKRQQCNRFSNRQVLRQGDDARPAEAVTAWGVAHRATQREWMLPRHALAASGNCTSPFLTSAGKPYREPHGIAEKPLAGPFSGIREYCFRLPRWLGNTASHLSHNCPQHSSPFRRMLEKFFLGSW
jgi:hypothetical protein